MAIDLRLRDSRSWRGSMSKLAVGAPGRSMRITSAPKSPSSMAAKGTGPMAAISITTVPPKGPVALIE
jgi:hypothetical protein